MRKHSISVDEIVEMGFIIKQIAAERINEGKNFQLSVDNTSGRFHSPLTQLKKGLRQYVRYDGQRLSSIDIVNSQPLLSLTLLDYDLFIRNGIYKLLAYYNPNHKELMNMDKVSRFYNPTSTMLVNFSCTLNFVRLSIK